VFRRNYVNPRNYADIPGGYPSGLPRTADSSFVAYPASYNLYENNISENSGIMFDIEASRSQTSNRYLGNISLNDFYGAKFTARGATLSTMPQNNLLKDFVVIGAKNIGIYARSSKNTQINNVTIIGAGTHGVAADRPSSYPGDGAPTTYSENTLVLNNRSYGFTMLNQSGFAIGYANAYGNAINFNPSASDARITNESLSNPQLGACKVFIPASSPLKGAGKNGADVGANVLYRYVNGTLTTQPLWAATTGQFPCGAVVAGVNDVAGTSCRNVHQRLNVDANGCTLPATYSAPSLTVSSPTNLRIIDGHQ
jgi:hypothetical protein